MNFQRIFEVRFAEHLVNVIEAVLHNRDGCIEVWKQISAEGTRHEKAEASGFLRKWTTGSNQIWLTALMGDVAKVFKNLQKNFQSDDLILTDVITCRDTAIRKLDLMSNAPCPGGCEKNILKTKKGQCKSPKMMMKWNQLQVAPVSMLLFLFQK